MSTTHTHTFQAVCSCSDTRRDFATHAEAWAYLEASEAKGCRPSNPFAHYVSEVCGGSFAQAIECAEAADRASKAGV